MRSELDMVIAGGCVLVDDQLVDATVRVADGAIAEIGTDSAGGMCLDAAGLLVLPGIVDVHGDAFERQLMPRPGVEFAIDVALIDSDRQAIANGITTVFHGVTWSWEPGLRGADNARGILKAIEQLKPRLAADTRFHLRHEVHNLAAEAEIVDWLTTRRIHALAFNDHLPRADARPEKLEQMVRRSGLSSEEFMALLERLRARTGDVPHSIARIAAAAAMHGVPLLSHDDASVEQRRRYRALGCRIAEFPMTPDTARDAASAGDDIVLGAPNVVRGKSHLGWLDATKMISDGLCTVLASDYYYPAPLLAAFRLADAGVAPIEHAWRLISEGPARAVGLADRGRIETGLRADVVLVDPTTPPNVVGVVAAGRLVYMTAPQRISHGHRARPRATADLVQ
jgi:alpha-D-ribose 1-methylphosphonate 5-triphosphate diphosphatase